MHTKYFVLYLNIKTYITTSILYRFQCTDFHADVFIYVTGIQEQESHYDYFKVWRWNEARHDKTNKMTCVPSEDSDQPGHPPSLIRVFAVHFMGSQGPKLSSCGQRRLWSDWVDAQADLSLRWMHTQFVGFVLHTTTNIISEVYC